MAILLSGTEIDRAIKRISHEIIEHNQGVNNLVLMGIPTRGAFLAERICTFINEIEAPVAKGVLDITLHRDDLRLRPPKPILPTTLPAGGIEGKDVVLVDDVLFSGRTIRAALDAIGELGRPRTVQLAVLIDRGHRQLPIRADYVGKNVPTSILESVKVHLAELDEEDLVELLK
jgi:pyrimidine operon attenuation protein/uracil phosphoribosyltransferase